MSCPNKDRPLLFLVVCARSTFDENAVVMVNFVDARIMESTFADRAVATTKPTTCVCGREIKKRVLARQYITVKVFALCDFDILASGHGYDNSVSDTNYLHSSTALLYKGRRNVRWYLYHGLDQSSPIIYYHASTC